MYTVDACTCIYVLYIHVYYTLIYRWILCMYIIYMSNCTCIYKLYKHNDIVHTCSHVVNIFLYDCVLFVLGGSRGMLLRACESGSCERVERALRKVKGQEDRTALVNIKDKVSTHSLTTTTSIMHVHVRCMYMCIYHSFTTSNFGTTHELC